MKYINVALEDERWEKLNSIKTEMRVNWAQLLELLAENYRKGKKGR